MAAVMNGLPLHQTITAMFTFDKKYLFSVLLMAAFMLVMGCQEAEGQMDRSAHKAELLDANAFEKALNGMQVQKVQLLDVRTPREWESGHLAEARLCDISKWDKFEAEVSKLDKDQPVFVYCAVGGRSAQAAKYLASQGFIHIIDLRGGLDAWRKADKNTIQ